MTKFTSVLEFLVIVFASTVTITQACSSLKQKESIFLQCKLPGTREDTNCYSGDLPQGTIVTYKCAKNYIPVNNDVKNGQLTCGNRKRWTGRDRFEAFSCSIDCGRSYDELAPFIVGGVPADRYDWPWHASIFAQLTPNAPLTYICGGTLVKPYSRGFVIISAAHCLADPRGVPRNPKILKVLLGANFSNWDENDAVPNVQRHEVREIKVHDSYAGSSSEFQADIAILSVKAPIKLNSNVQPACFSGGDDLTEIGALGTVVGFGAYEFNNPTASKTLRLAKLPIVKKDKCYEWRERKLLPQELCAGYSGTQSACNGDSGGGLVFPKSFNKVERYYLEGIVSHGRRNIENKKEGCDSFSVFTKVNSYDAWIRDKAEEMFSEDFDEGEVAPEEPEQKLGAPRPSPSLPSQNNQNQRPVIPQSPSGVQNVRPQPTPSRAPVPVRPSVPSVDISQIQPSNPNDFKSVGLDLHNFYRQKHGSPPVRLNEKLNRNAQAYAEKLLREGGLANEYEEGINKNVYRHTGHTLVPEQSVKKAVDYWYASIKSYNWNRPTYSTFSQVVWKSTTHIGVGHASQGRDAVIVISYSPPGNQDGENGKYYHENVLPLQQ